MTVKIRRNAAILLLTAVCVLLAVYFVASSHIGENRIRLMAESRLSDALGTRVAIGELSTNLLTQLTVTQVVVGMTETDSTGISLRRGYIRIRPWDILRRRLTIAEVAIEGLLVVAGRDSTGLTGIPVPVGGGDGDAEGGGLPFDIHLDRAHIHDSGIGFHDRVVALDCVLTDIDALAEHDDGSGYRFSLSTGAGQFRYRGNPVDIPGIDIEGGWSGGVLQLTGMSLGIGEMGIEGDVSLDTREAPPVLDGSLQVSGDPGSLAPVLSAVVPERIMPLAGGLSVNLSFADMLGTGRRIGAEARIDSLDTAGIVLRGGHIAAEWDNGALKVDDVAGQLLGGTFGGSGSIDMAHEMSHEVSLHVSNMDFDELWRLLGLETPYQGQFSGSVASQGTFSPDGLRVDADLRVHRLTYGTNATDPFIGTISYDRGALSARIEQDSTVVRADVINDRGALNGTLEATIGRLQPVMLLFGITGLDAGGVLHGTLSGTIDNPSFVVTVERAHGQYRHIPVSSLSGRLRYHDGRFTVEESRFRGGFASVDSLKQEWGLPAAIRGGMEYSGTFSGWVDDMQIDFSAELDAPAWNDFRFDNAAMALHLDDRMVTLDHLRLNRGGQSISAAARYAIDRSLVAANVTVDAHVPVVVPDLPEPGHVHDGPREMVELPVDDGGLLRVFCDFSGPAGILASASGGGIDIGRLASVYDDSLHVSGTLAFRSAFRGTPQRPDGALKLAVADPRLNDVALDSLSVSAQVDSTGVALDSLNVYIGEFRTWAQGILGLVRAPDGSLGITAASGISGSAQGRGFDLAMLVPFLPASLDLRGGSSYDLVWGGTVGAPQITGDLAIRRGAVSRRLLADNDENGAPDTMTLVDSLTVDLAFRDSVLTIETVTGVVQQTAFSLGGTVAVLPEGRYGTDLSLQLAGGQTITGAGTIDGAALDLSIDTDAFELGVLQPFVPGVGDLGGLMRADVNIAGTLAEPDLHGSVRIDSLRFQPPGIDAGVSDGSVAVSFNRNMVSLDSLSVSIGGGSVGATGSLVRENGHISGIAVDTNIHNVTLQRKDVFSATINSADISLSEDGTGYLVSGDVVLGESTLEYTVQPQMVLSQIRKDDVPGREPSPLLSKTRLAVRLRESERLWIDNNLAHVRLHSELEFVGTLAAPNVTGRLSIEEGYILYLDRKFTVSQGIVDFVNRQQLEPIIEFDAAANIESYQTYGGDAYVVNLQISGPIDEAQLRLTSEPQLSRSDIVSLLTFGATGEQLVGRDGADNATVRNILADRIAKLGSAQISNYVSRELIELLGIDEVTIQGNLFDFSGNTGPQLVASEQINDRLALTYTTNVGQLNQQGIRLDYKLSKFFSLEGHTNQTGKTGLDVKYTIKFK